MYTIADDTLNVGRGDTMEEANVDHENLSVFLDRCHERRIRLNPDKLDFKKEEVKFTGHILTSNGLKVDPEKVAVIANMPIPENLEALQRFIGMV